MAESAPNDARYHPYDKKKPNRRPWYHSALENSLFTEVEIKRLGVSHRRPVYTASLEAHIDKLHAQLESLGPGYFPVDMQDLKDLKGQDVRLCKNLVIGLEHDVAAGQRRLLQLQAKNKQLEAALASLQK